MNRLKHAHLEPAKTSRKEPLTEEISRKAFSEQELQTIISQRALLIAKNLTDEEISRELSQLIDHPAGGIRQKIRQLVKLEQLPENPNKQEHEGFTEQELQTIISQRPVLIAKNLPDNQISKELSKQLNRSAASISGKVRKLVKAGKVPENPNKLLDFTPEEIQTIIQQRGLLIEKNLKDLEISKIISKLIKHSNRGIYEKLRMMINENQIPANPNKSEQNDFSKKELSIIIQRRSELIKEGMNDTLISKRLSSEKHSWTSIYIKIRQLIKHNDVHENPNKRHISSFTENDISIIKNRREELAKQNFSDPDISKILSLELSRSAMSIIHKIQRLINEKQLPENKKREKKEFSSQEIDLICKERFELIRVGLNDGEIASYLSKKLSRSAGSIIHKFRKLIMSNHIQNNPNKRGRNFTETELLGQLTEAIDVYTGEKNE